MKKLILLFTLLSCSAFAASQTRIVGTGTNDASVGDVPITDPGDITANDGNNTGIVGGDRIQDAETSQRLKGTTLGNVFTIPTDATIDSIRCIIDIIDNRNKDEGTDLEVKLLKAGVVVGTDQSKAGTVPGTQTEITYAPGGLWGTTWTPAQINATDFGLAWRGDTVTGSVGERFEVGIDHFTIVVIYTPAASTSRIIIVTGGE